MSPASRLKLLAIGIGLLVSACAPNPATGIAGRALSDRGAAPETPQVYSTPEPVEKPTVEVPPAPEPSPATPGPWGPVPYTPPSPKPPWYPFPFPPYQPPKPVTPPKPPAPPTPPSPPKPDTGNLLEFFTRNYAQSFGLYFKGHLEKADVLPNSGDGLLKVFQLRNRAYGSLDMTTLLPAVGKRLRHEIPASEPIQVGDIAGKNGGKIGGHDSHQNGLDADVIFLRHDHRTMDPLDQKANQTGFDEDFVASNGEVTRNFDVEANWMMIQLLDSTHRLDRIFLDQHIKKRFCQYAVERGMRGEWAETLRKLRHSPLHRDHMHVRITCPPSSKQCKPFSPLPAGDGCDKLLDRGAKRASGFLALPTLFGTDDALNTEEPELDEHGC